MILMFQKKKQTKQIPVTVDKSHLITIGEKLYTEKMSFVRELVNNAYDADASVVTVDIKTDRITIRDNGSGMDEADLRRYFAIGASEKRVRSFSPVYGRKRIGEFGIGKFAALAASKKFEIDTQRGDFHARLIFDKENWSQHEDWHLNTEILESKKEDGDGTIITLLDVSFTFYPGNVRRYLSERVPIHSPDFSVYLNGEKVEDAIVSGKKITIKKKCDYGTIEGEMIIIPEGTKNPRTGIGIYVKDVLVKYEPFGLGGSKKYGSGRVAGKINADFLPITSSRDDFIRDSDEFVKFRDIVICELKKILKKLKKEGNYKANLKASRVLKEALDRIGRAMKGNKEMIPGVQLSLGGDTGYPGDDGIGHVDNTEGYKISKAEFTNKGKKKSQIINSSSSENVIDKDKKSGYSHQDGCPRQ
jgi:hypothetical protein